MAREAPKLLLVTQLHASPRHTGSNGNIDELNQMAHEAKQTQQHAVKRGGGKRTLESLSDARARESRLEVRAELGERRASVLGKEASGRHGGHLGDDVVKRRRHKLVRRADDLASRRHFP